MADMSLDVKSLKIRHVEPKDLEFINKFMEIEHYDVGLTNIQMYFECSNTKLWKCIENTEGEIIVIDLGNLLPNGVDYGYILIVNPIYRGQGISNLFKAQWSDHPYMGSESLKSVSIYSDVLQCWRGKMLVFYGMVPKSIAENYVKKYSPKRPDFQLVRINNENVSKIFEYDKQIIKFDRKKFLKQWCCTVDSISVMALKNNKCVGFGVLRNFTGVTRFGISPLYADDENIATAIFAKLAENLDHQYLYVPAMSDKRTSIHFCHSIHLNFFNVEVRDCNLGALSYVKTLDLSKVYTPHDYWPV